MMQVTLIAMTQLVPGAIESVTPYRMHDGISDIDQLHEIAGRACYESWDRPNPKTATNEGYMGHIDDVKHYSIEYHGSVSFHVTGVSRAMLLELERHSLHMNVGFSVLSQRYCDQGIDSDITVVNPPVFDDFLNSLLEEHFQASQRFYEDAVQRLVDTGYTRKEARGAARAFLPENTETRFIVTGSIRAWRDIITKRYSKAADVEIREFAAEVKRILLEVAPNSMIGI